MVWTNIGKQKMFEATFEGSALPSYFTFMLATSATGTFDADLSSTSQITLVSSGTGYASSGLRVNRDGVDLSVSANLTSDYARATVRANYFEWTAAGGPINDVAYVLLADDGANPLDRTIWAFWALSSELDIPDTAKLRITTGALQGT